MLSNRESNGPFAQFVTIVCLYCIPTISVVCSLYCVSTSQCCAYYLLDVYLMVAKCSFVSIMLSLISINEII